MTAGHRVTHTHVFPGQLIAGWRSIIELGSRCREMSKPPPPTPYLLITRPTFRVVKRGENGEVYRKSGEMSPKVEKINKKYTPT